MSAVDLLRALFPGGLAAGEFIELRSITPARAVRQQYFETPEALVAAANKLSGANLHYSLGARRGKAGKKKDTAFVGAVFADVDFKVFDDGEAGARAALDRFPLPASAVVYSGGGYQALWFLAERAGPEYFDVLENVNRGLAIALAPEGRKLDAAIDASRVFRLPGFLNLKPEYDPPPLARLVELDPERRYDLTDFAPFLPTLTVPAAGTARNSAPVDVDDATLLREAFGNPKNGTAIRALWDGTVPAGKTPSQADEALLCHLAYYTGGDAGRMERLFGQSGLCRDKWTERADYRRMSIENAIARTTSSWEPWTERRSGSEAGDAGADIGAGGGYGDDDGLIAGPGNPLPNARRYLARFHPLVDGQPTLVSWGGSFYSWVHGAWAERDPEGVDSTMYEWLERKKYRDAKEKAVPFAPTKRKIADLHHALAGIVHLDRDVAPPAWLPGVGVRPPAQQFVPFQNGLLHIKTREMLTPTPAFFNLNALPYEYDPAAPAPALWLKFLNELWGDDVECIELVQEWFGYVLSGGTEQEKILLMVGPKRGGKGTIVRVLTALVGQANAAFPSLAAFGQNFGLEPVIGKSLAVIADARMDKQASNVASAVSEKLLNISGEDRVTIDRKYQRAWSGKLGCRVVIVANELPKLVDASGALASRFVLATTHKSFLGKEDPELTDKLLEELRGIVLWALDGLERLRKRGRFVQPKSSVRAIQELEELGSPVMGFVRERCVIDPGCQVGKQELFEQWREWCTQTGRPAGAIETFGKNLRAVVPSLGQIQPRGGGSRGRYYTGVRLRGSNEPTDDESDADESGSGTGGTGSPVNVSHTIQEDAEGAVEEAGGENSRPTVGKHPVPPVPLGRGSELLEPPLPPCERCGQQDWWLRGDGFWACGGCDREP